MWGTRPLLWGLGTLTLVSSAVAQNTDVDFRLVATAFPTVSESVTTLPESIEHVCVGDTYFIELWASDVGAINTGVSSAYVKLVWPGTRATAVSIYHGTLYNTLPSGTIVFGTIEELGGSALTPHGVAIEPEWARVAAIEMIAEANRTIAYTLEPSEKGIAALGRGVIPWADVFLGEVTVAAPNLGDLNCDGGVDLDDYAIFERCMAGPGVSTPPNGCAQEEFLAAEMDADDDVDLDDFCRFQTVLEG